MSASVYINLAVQALQRNNPILELLARIQSTIDLVLNYQSNVKLNKYRHSLYQQQLKRMEGFLTTSSPYTYRGNKMDRRF
jgi:hypothetical protein